MNGKSLCGDEVIENILEQEFGIARSEDQKRSIGSLVSFSADIVTGGLQISGFVGWPVLVAGAAALLGAAWVGYRFVDSYTQGIKRGISLERRD